MLGHRVPITVRLENFEGPLDLLLYLIHSHELDINQISITRITDQYLAYVRLMQELNFDTASEFLVMAATLLHWKSKSLLPRDPSEQAAPGSEEEVFTREDLVRQLLEHQRFLAAGQELAELPRLGEDVFIRPNLRPPTEKVWKEMSITAIGLAYQDILIRSRKRVKVLKKETVSLNDKIEDFRKKLILGAKTELRALLSDFPDRPEVVVSFLLSLELSRMKKLRLHQDLTYSPIYLELVEPIDEIQPGALETSLTTGAAPA